LEVLAAQVELAAATGSTIRRIAVGRPTVIGPRPTSSEARRGEIRARTANQARVRI
jgi:hypothetical protein